jgi:glycosidase
MKIPLRKNPHIYEINLMTWLSMLSKREGRQISIGSIPGAEWKRLREMGIDIVWLMGVWQRSPLSVEIARNESGLVVEGRAILADFEMEDIVGSPYSVRDYRPDSAFGRTADLEDLSNRLEDEGLLLVLDFVPNHTACDHPWIY